MEVYRKYFDIDPDFFPAVNNDVIKKEPELWKKYYPHETFIALLKQTLNVLERKQKLNIWVEGAYGTGKSHAVLTLKHLLDAKESEVDEYFNTFHLDEDLRKKFNAVKAQGRIITVHRYGSSSIHSDNDLFLSMQESIEAALKEAGIDNAGPNALKDGVIKYLSDEENKQSFEVYVKGSYSELFGGESVDDIVKHLGEYQDQALQELMNKIFRVGNEKNIKAFSLDDTMMMNWISEVIKANNLKAIVFIWDEFTEYFFNNAHRLTGFQRILDMSQTEPFCFIPVTHKSGAGMDDADSDKKKILDRFVQPCIIELPDNMAFQLMGAAMQKNRDSEVLKEWEEILVELESRTHDSRKRIMDKAGIKDNELRGILPIHPYAACVLKHISSSFASNQRSMFDFIKNSGNEDLKGFQWYMDNYGPFDESPFLTIDLLWAFFYDNGKKDLSINIRHILDRYASLSKQLNNDEKNVLKTVLLLQAISQSTGDSVEIFLPNEKNLTYAYEGSHLDGGLAVQCAEKLVKDKVLYKRNFNDGSFLYSVLTGEMDANQIEKEKSKFEGKSTTSLLADVQVEEALELDHDLKLRFNMSFVGPTDLDAKAKQVNTKAMDDPRHFQVVVGLSRDDNESAVVSKKIQDHIANGSEVIFIDCGKTPLTQEEFEKWVENMATSAYNSGKDNSTAAQYNTYAKQVLANWRARIKQGQFVLYSKAHPAGHSLSNLDALNAELRNIDRKRFNLALECNFRSISPWWAANSLGVGIECGVTRNTKGTYKSAIANLEQILANAWNSDTYWLEHPSDPISRIKSQINGFIEEKLKNDGRISILEIYNKLTDAPCGFLPCNMTAFFIGFLLKEYVDDRYSWSDGISSDNMSLLKMKEMVEEVIRNDMTPSNRYRNKYIVTMTPEEKAFSEGTSIAFDIPKENCSSIESARDRIRKQMKSYSFPIWTLTYILSEQELQTPVSVIDNLISNYQNLVNNQTGKSDSDIANEIGKTFMANKNAASDLSALFTEDKCKQGMLRYLDEYKEGALPEIANQVEDHGQYINELRQKLNASEEANWLWKRQTVDLQIDSVILEYQIIAETSKLLVNCNSFNDSIAAWNDKVGNIKVAYETVKSYVSDLQPFLSMLKEIKQSGTLKEDKKEQFLNYLRGYGAAFNKFYTSQFDLFKQACNFYLQELSDSDKEKVYKRITSGQFTTDNATYCKTVEDTVAAYRKELGSIRLKSLWKEKTNSESPNDWSNKYQMPILALIPDDDVPMCREVFGTINMGNPSDKEIEKALNYLEKFDYWTLLNDENARNRAFNEKILGEYAVMLSDIQDVKDYLSSHVSDTPYHWMGNSQVQNVLKSLANSKYVKEGYLVAMEKIDSMNAEDVKRYLKDLIKNNMNVGVQIIMNN